VTAGASIELAERLLGRRCSVERPITVDQTNFSVVVDEAVVVKWLRPPVPAPHPGVQLIDHLTTAGFDEMPAFVGTDEREGLVHAIVTAYLPGAADGWDWYVDDVESWLAGTLPFESLTSSARQMGSITARMHRCLADLERAAIDASAVAEQAMTDLRVATGRLDGLEWLDESVVAAALRPLIEARQVSGHRIHGDLHAGQFLRAGSVMQVTDFDGNPLQDVVGRARPQSPLRDVASMLQSIAHVGSVAVKRRRPDRAIDVERFTGEAMRVALDAYRTMHDVDERMLLGFRVAQELHEYAYSIQHLPHWRYVADDALPRLLDCR
jgi:maltokinase